MKKNLPLFAVAGLLSFLTCGAAEPAGDTGAEALRLVDGHAITFTEPARCIPTSKMVDGPLLGNGDLGVTIAGNPQNLRFHIGKNDFWSIREKTPKTVGRIELLIPELAGASYEAVGDMRRAGWTGKFKQGGASLRVRAFVDANANRILIELENTGKSRLLVGGGLVRGELSPAEGLSFLHAYDGDIEGARKVALAVSPVGQKGFPFALWGGAKVVVAASVLSDLDAKNPLDAALVQVNALNPKALADINAAHEARWDAFWKKSFIEIPDKLIEQHWYSSQYILGSCCREGKVAPGIWGNWITMNRVDWSGDYHLNYNFQAPFYVAFSSNHVDLAEPFFKAMNDAIPLGERHAKQRGWKGVHLPTGIGPNGVATTDYDYEQRSNAVYSALLYGWRWRSTQDKAWLEKDGYPYMRGVAEFWTDYLKLEGGRYVIHNDAVHEKHAATDMNPIFSLGAVRALYRDILDMSEALGVDAELRSKWRDILEKISAFPTQEKNGKTVFRYTEKGTPWWWNNTVGIQHIYPAGAIGLDSDPKLLEISRNMIDVMNRWRDYNGSNSWYAACARVGYQPEKALSEMHEMYEHHSMPNRLLNFGGGGVENVSPSAAINEMLLQSHEGVLRLFPSWPRKLDARFGTLRAYGAFLVSAELEAGVVSGVSILSEKGRDCVVQNPWPGKSVAVARGGKPAETVSGERFTLKTSANETLALAPAL